MSKQYKKYSEVPNKYKWDLEDILDGKTKEELLDEVVKKFDKLLKFKPKAYTTKENFIKWNKMRDEMLMDHMKILNYSQNSTRTNVVDQEANAFMMKVHVTIQQLIQKMGPINPDIFKNAKKIKEWIQDPKLKPWKRSYEITLEDKKRELPKAIQEYRQKTALGNISSYEVFNILYNSEIKFGKTEGSIKKEITSTNLSTFRKHKDPKVRKSALLGFENGYLGVKQTLSNLLYQHLRQESVEAKLHKFNSTVESHIHADRFPEETLLQLYESVKKGKDVFKKYKAARKTFFKAKYKKPMTRFDTELPLVNVEPKYTIEQGQKIILDMTKPLGKEYNEIAKKAFKEKWVDYAMVNGKHTGAYSIGLTYAINKKYILMNWNSDYRSLSTLAHELGHSIHSFFSDKTQTLHDSQYPIFLAEIASIFNEILLKDHLMKNKNITDEEKFFMLEQSIDSFFSTVVAQTQWSNYEYEVLKAIDENKPMGSFEALSKVYLDIEAQYSTSKKIHPNKAMNAIRIPHYYSSFYVYKYAIGYLAANIFYQKYLDEGKDALQQYINKFLSAGNRDWPMEILKDAGIDLNDPKVYELGFNRVKQDIDEFVKLGNKIFKLNK